MNEQKKQNGRGIFYGVIGVATLVVAIIGATFAYFTASQTNNNVITGNMATVNFGLAVTPVVNPGVTNGIIPMSNNMIEKAVANGSTKGVCVDDNGNAVCQIYKITVTNSSTATMFVDGYVALAGGSGIPTDTATQTKNHTTMRWAQVFTTNDGTTYTTAGDQILGADTEKVTMASLDTTGDTTGFNAANIKTTADDIVTPASDASAVTISGNKYATVKTNFIRTSDHKVVAGTAGTSVDTIDSTVAFNRNDDITSMLVLSQQLQPDDGTAGSGKDEVVYYIAVWLSETGTNQTAGATTGTGTNATTNPNAANFFNGTVAFLSAQGSEVTATFSGYTAVKSDNAATTTP